MRKEPVVARTIGLRLGAPPVAPVVVFVDGPARATHTLVGDRWAGGWRVIPDEDRWRVMPGGHDDPTLPGRAEVHATGLVAACAGQPYETFGGGVAPSAYVAAIDAMQPGPLEAIERTRHPGPLIVVLAVSTWTVPPLGDSPVEKAIDRRSQRDGRYVLCAAGNHGAACLHASVDAGFATQRRLSMVSTGSTNFNSTSDFETWVGNQAGGKNYTKKVAEVSSYGTW